MITKSIDRSSHLTSLTIFKLDAITNGIKKKLIIYQVLLHLELSNHLILEIKYVWIWKYLYRVLKTKRE